MTDFMTFVMQHAAVMVGVAIVVALVTTLLAAIAWVLLRAERARHQVSQDRAGKLDENTITFRREIGMPLGEIEQDLRFAEQKTDDIVATVTAFQRLYAASRDFTVTPELLFELKDLTKSVDSRELLVELPERIRQALKELEILSAVADASSGAPQRKETLQVVAAAAADDPVDDTLHAQRSMMKTRAF